MGQLGASAAYKILLLEDNPITGLDLKEALGINYEVCWVKTKQDALEQLQALQFQLAILDLAIGNNPSAGIEVAKYIKKQLKIPFIYLTCNLDQRIWQDALMVFPHSYLPKPLNANVLEATITNAFFTYAKQQQFAWPKSPYEEAIFIKKARLKRQANGGYELQEDKDNWGKSKLNQADILWVQTKGNRIFIKTVDQAPSKGMGMMLEQEDCYCLSTTLRKFKEYLNPWFLKQASASAIINLNYVKGIVNQNTIRMQDNSIIRITQPSLLDYFTITKAR